MAVGRSFFRSNSSGIFPKRTEVYWLLIFHLSLCSSDMKDLPGKSQPSKSLSTQLLCLFDQPSPFQLLFGDIVCFGQIDRGANQLEQCSCSEWDGWDSIHQLEICDWEWHSCIPWFAILMGVNQLAAMVHYWRKDPILIYSPIVDCICRDHFMEICPFCGQHHSVWSFRP